jgi:transposase
MGYHATLSYGNSAWGATGFRRVGSTTVSRRAPVRAGRVAGGGGPDVGCDADDRLPLACGLEGRRAAWAEGRGAGGPEATVDRVGVGRARGGLASRRARPRVHDRPVDLAPGRDRDRTSDGRPLSPRPRVVPVTAVELVPAAPGTASAGARRGHHSAVGAAAVARGKKNARRQRAWLLFEDESGLSTQPVVRRTWAPRGETPVLIHPFRHWERLSVAAALAFRWDGRRSRLFFQTRPGAYTTTALIGFLRQLQRHFRRRRVILLWDGLPAHRSRQMRDYLTQQGRWLTVERLPAYAPDLNPAEPLFGNVKGSELANHCEDLPILAAALRSGMARVRRRPALARAFLQHAGLSL